MTPEEIVTSILTANLEILVSPDSANLSVVDLMNKAGIAAFAFGVNTSNAMHQGALEVLKAQISK